MASKAKATDQTAPDTPFTAMAQLQEAGLGNVMGLGTVWLESFSDMGAEVMDFVARRIQEDVKTQHKILHCKSLSELQHIQLQFIERAIEQYQAETGKLVEMGTNAFKTGQETTEKD